MAGRKRYSIRFTGPATRRIVAWLQLLIPVLRQAPEEIEIEIEITARKEGPDADPDRPDRPG